MDKELKVKWVAALRSGDYKQGKKRLRSDGAYCCLGVLCAIAGRNDDWHEYAFGPFHGGAYGLTEEEASELVGMNDWKGMTFSEIADYIEKHL